MSEKEKLSQAVGMFLGDGTGIPPEILHRFDSGLGEVSFVPGTSTTEEDRALSDKEKEIMASHGKLPPIRHNEALTGQMTMESTVFPSAIGLGATFDPESVQEMADVIRRQMLSDGTRQALSPVMDVARDPRWGRVGETYGEDPTLCSMMSVAFVKGLQTDDLMNGVIATGKHFLGYANSEGGLNMATNPISARELREVYAKPFQAAITEANLASIMNSYGVVDNELIIASKEILTKLLKEEMGFDGLVVSDYMSINKATDLKIAETPEEAGVEALKAGLDVELPMPYGFTDKMLTLLENDEEGQAALNRAAEKVVEAKLALGLLDGPAYKQDDAAFDRAMTKPLSLRLAKEAIVLLKNENILPLKKDVKKIGVIGPHADSIRLLFGCYTYAAAFDRDTSGSMSDMPGMQNTGSGRPESEYKMDYFPGCTVRQTHPFIEETLKKQYGGRTETILATLKKALPDAEIRYAKGCDVAGNDRSGFAESEKIAEWADVLIVTSGGKYGWGTSCTTGEGIDCDKIGLTGVQKELILSLAKKNQNLVLIHMDSKPLADEELVKSCPAILENWFPGDTGGEAIISVLFGDTNPAGRLPQTAPRSEGQIPIYTGQKRGSGYHPGEGMTIAKYVENEKTPLFPFGHGLSYTTFAYSDLEVTENVAADGAAEISFTVENTGNAAGEEVAQLYVSDVAATMIRPMKEFAGAARVALEPSEKKRVAFTVRADQFAFLNRDMRWIVEKGSMDVQVGASSEDIRLNGSFTITETREIDARKRGFYAKVQIV